ncbi:MAG: hypothetical protein Q9181_004528 [Wetmoreana brouardii]
MSPLREPPALPDEILMMAESQWIFDENELLRTPSILEGTPPEKERENRGKGVNFIFQVGMMLRLPQVTLATASVLLHRFFMRHSMNAFHYYSMAATSLYLATKIEEDCRKMKDLVVACVRVAQKDSHKIVDEQDKEYWRWRDNILHNEDVLLEALCFDLTLDPPYKLLFEYLNYFGESDNRRLRNSAWAFINDSCITTLCLQFPSRTIAAAALYAAAKHCRIYILDDEEGRPWWESVGVDLKAIKHACNCLATVYEQVHVKNGRDVSIHQKTPEDGDESVAKTRAVNHWSATRSHPDGHEQVDMTESPTVGGSNVVDSSRKRVQTPGEVLQESMSDGRTPEQHGGFARNGLHQRPDGEGHTGLGKQKKRMVAGGGVAINGAADSPGPPLANGHIAEDYISEEGEVES